MDKRLTIVIPSKNEGRGIIEVLKLIQEQVDCEIIIADSSDEEGSMLILKKYLTKNKNIRLVQGGLPSIARNNGAKFSQTPYTLFLDADVYVYNPFLIERCLFDIIQGNYDLLTCKFKTDYPYRWVYRVFDIIQLITSVSKPFAIGGFMLFKTETFNKLGGFNEEDKIAEDYRLSSKIKPKKFKISNNYVFTPSRRFYKKSVWYMIKIMVGSWINLNNNSYFKNDQSYWNEKN